MSTAQAGARRMGIQQRMTSRAWRRTIAFYVFIAPWLIGFILLGVIPLILGFLTSLTNYDGLNLATIKFIGALNYTRALVDPDVSFSFGRTLLWGALNTPAWLILSFVLALILNQAVSGRGLFRTLYYIPSIIPAVATVWVWKIFLDQNYGLLNALISVFRPGTAIPWLSGYALAGLTAIAVWGGLGGGMVIFLAGLQGIPDEVIEAARMDGASTMQVLRHVTIPLMTPVIFFQLVLALIGSFQQLTLPLLLGKGAGQLTFPPRAIYLYMLNTYYQIFVYQRFGYGIALLWLLFVVVMLLTWLVFRSARYWVYSEVSLEGGER